MRLTNDHYSYHYGDSRNNILWIQTHSPERFQIGGLILQWLGQYPWESWCPVVGCTCRWVILTSYFFNYPFQLDLFFYVTRCDVIELRKKFNWNYQFWSKMISFRGLLSPNASLLRQHIFTLSLLSLCFNDTIRFYFRSSIFVL